MRRWEGFTPLPEFLRPRSTLGGIFDHGRRVRDRASPVPASGSKAPRTRARFRRSAVAQSDSIEAHLRMPPSLRFDYRRIAGDQAARFLAAVIHDLQKGH